MKKDYKLIAIKGTTEILLEKIEDVCLREAQLKAQKALKDDTALKYILTSDIKVVLKEEKSDISYKIKWVEPNFSAGNKIFKDWVQYKNDIPTNISTDFTKNTVRIVPTLFNIGLAVLAFLIILAILRNDKDDATVYNAIIFLLSLVVNMITPIVKIDLKIMAESRYKLFWYNIKTSIPSWLIIGVTITFFSKEDVIMSQLKVEGFAITIGVIFILAILKLFIDYAIDLTEYHDKKLEDLTFTEVKEKSSRELSIAEEVLFKEIEKSIPTEIKKSKWEKRHISLHLFLLSIVFLQYFLLKNPKKNTLRDNLFKS